MRGVVSFLTSIIISLYASWALGLVIMPAYFLIVVGSVMRICLTMKHTAKIKALLEKAGRIASEAIENIHTIASLGLQSRMERIYTAQLNKMIR